MPDTIRSESTPRPAPKEVCPAPSSRHILDFLRGPLDMRSFALTCLLVLASLYSLYFARPFLLPVVLSGLLTLLLRPIVRGMARARIPEPIGAAVVVLGLVAVLIALVYGLSGPVAGWLRSAPANLERIEARIHPLVRPIKQVNEATAKVEEKIDAATPEIGGTQEVEIKQPSLSGHLLSRASGFIGAAVAVLILLYFLLASGDLFLRKLVKVLPDFERKKQAVEIAHEVQEHVSTYLFTVTLINLGLGLAVTAVMYLLGMPNPALWGVMAAVLNFIPYLGALFTFLVIGGVALLTFDNTAYALAVPLAFVTLSTLEGYFVTPLVLGQRLTLNPVVIFLGMTFWWWLWGIPGALLAVPMLAVLKILCDHIEPLAPIGEFLGR